MAGVPIVIPPFIKIFVHTGFNVISHIILRDLGRKKKIYLRDGIVRNLKKVRVVQKRLQYFFTVLQMLFLVFFVVFVSPRTVATAAGPTRITLTPANQTVFAGDTVSIAVVCSPQQAIKAFELKVSFDPSLLQAITVSEGDMFETFTTFFSAGIINNTAGTIVDIYDLIIGVGNVTNTGTLVVMNFTATSLNGTSPLSLYDVQVTNESDYLEVIVTSGSVTVTGGSNPSEYLINATAGSGGHITPVGNVLVRGGANQAFTITPDIGYTIQDVVIDGGSVGSISAYTFFMVGVNHTIAASFAVVQNPPPSEPPDGSSSENTPPSHPLQPRGLTLVKAGSRYNYSSAACDPDGNLVRLRFDWGDGSLSNWTGFMASNTSVSVSHIWMNVSTCFIRVIAQDINGANSSWSDLLMVNITGQESNGSLLVGVFLVPKNISSNHSFVFDASGIFDPDGSIVSYQWDFGDGTTGFGENPVHTYYTPGMYTVVLTVIDSTGAISTLHKVITVFADSGVSLENKQSIFLFYINIIILSGVVALFLILIKFRDHIAKIYIQKRIETTKKRLVLKGYNDTSEIDQFIDELFLGTSQKIPIFTKDSILTAYTDLISAKVRKNPSYNPPNLSIEEIEKLVDRRIQGKIEAEVDKL